MRIGRLYSPEDTTGTHFCYRLSRTQGHSASGRIKSTNNPNDPNGNGTRNLPACSAVPQPAAPPRIHIASFTERSLNFWHNMCSLNFWHNMCSLNFWHNMCSKRASGWMTKESRSNFRHRQRPNRSWGTPNFLLNGYWLFLLRGKKSRRDGDYLRPSGAEVKNKWKFLF